MLTIELMGGFLDVKQKGNMRSFKALIFKKMPIIP